MLDPEIDALIEAALRMRRKFLLPNPPRVVAESLAVMISELAWRIDQLTDEIDCPLPAESIRR